MIRAWRVAPPVLRYIACGLFGLLLGFGLVGAQSSIMVALNGMGLGFMLAVLSNTIQLRHRVVRYTMRISKRLQRMEQQAAHFETLYQKFDLPRGPRSQ